MTTDHQSPDELADLAELMRHEQEFPARSSRDDATRRRRRRRGLIVTAVVTAIVLGTAGGYVGWALTAPLSAPVITSSTPEVAAPAAAVIALPSEGASAVSVSGGDAYLGAAASGTWSASGTDEPRSIASISKLITALVVLDAKPLANADDPGPTITFDKADHDLYDKYYVMGATIAAMPTGSSMSQRDALSTMLIPSASNYAEAVSTWAFGSQSAFLNATRRWLAAQGLTGTTIVEPTGISPRNTSTPADLLAIGKLAAANPAIAKIVATRSLSLPGPGGMSNTNDLLGSDGITGLKTGNLGEGSYSLLYTASLDVGAGEPLSVTGVVLGGQSRQSVNVSVLSLLDSIRGGFHEVPLSTAGQQVGSYSTPWGATARMVVAENSSIFTWSDTAITSTMDTTTPTAYEDGEVVGSITWNAGPNTVTAAVEVEGTIRPPTAWWRLTHPSELGGR
ncbi:D-alanyl-D-alanine carboxypeptidase family protein [Microbacterium allomyrinae]|uniref:D-alanyl-D-alanine carboxypeptidase n=1 Tax=Microbacterium allomyrinae TaxID=2830666 RepID=A0A9X1S2Q2_9MICO|nr:D-alanyl-D-alanine carboxypeptidase [Microbacterium allomyrinae]MCC2031290.1 D-alanyl-D-alanine carboxypeptidase [Microbacterium allomyrinae]